MNLKPIPNCTSSFIPCMKMTNTFDTKNFARTFGITLGVEKAKE